LKAYDICKTIKDITVPADLLDDIANSYADLDDYQNAFTYAKLSAKAKESRRLVDAQNRAVAMQVKHDNERHRAEAEHLRRIAKSEADRAASLQESSNTLETLGLIGREITANLNAQAVFESLHRHVNDLLDATSFGISLLSEDSQTLHSAV
jgi:DNA polymerase III sliding clamp (beta) subunit (PCNA family)